MEIITLEEFSITGLIVEATWEELGKVIPNAWREVFSLKLASNAKYYDISLEEKNGEYIECIGAKGEIADNVNKEYHKITIPKQKVVHHVHEGSLSAIATTYGRIYEWAEKNRIKLDDFKIDEGYSKEMNETRHDLYIGIKEEAEKHYYITCMCYNLI